MKKKQWLILSVIIFIIIIVVGLVTYNILNDKNKLSSIERTWINSNINNVHNINVIKNENGFSKDGSGVFYSFLDDFSKEYGLSLNVVTFEENSDIKGISLNVTNYPNNDDKIFYTDHYVLIGKNLEYIKSNKDLEGKTISVLSSDLEYVKSYLKEINITFNNYDKIDDLLKSEVSYIILPRLKYIDEILKKDFQIIYHLSDINIYYVLDGIDDTLSSILSKYFVKWEEEINKNLKKEEFKIFTSSLNIQDPDIDKLLSVDYNYGFINNSPYEVIMSGNYGGIIAEYLQEFSEFSGVYFNISKYKNIDKLVKGINKNKVDIYYDFNKNIEDNYLKTNNGINSSVSIITRTDNEKVINSLYGLQGEDVYVETGSNISNYLTNIGSVNLHYYDNLKELYKLNNEDVIIAMDTYIFDYLNNTKLDNYISKLNTYIDFRYQFKIKAEYKTLQTLLDKYINYLDINSMINKGLNSHSDVMENGHLLNNIAKYIILVVVAILIIGLIVYRKTKKIRIARRLKKDEKIRFIDELTCLKNRAYLSDFMKTWSNNTIYPQAVVVVDLNKLTEINDKYGVTEGDKQIQAFANALIKTQLDNSDLMRSDGNEFVIYTVGYTQKQIINYIHKLNKELKRLPYNYGAEFGYSIIENNLKTVEDALTEAIEDMKEKKGTK